MAAPRLPKALWVLPASLLAAVIAGALLGDREPPPPTAAQVQQTAAVKARP